MKKTEFKRVFGYRDQAPRCYLCADYKAGLCLVPQPGDPPMKVKPNGICTQYKPGPSAKTSVAHEQRTALIAWQFQAAGAALENQRLRAVLKSVEEIVLEAPELNMSNFDEDQVSSLNEAMISICGILLQESARKDQGMRHGR